MTLPSVDQEQAIKAVESLHLTIRELALYLHAPERHQLLENVQVGVSSIRRAVLTLHHYRIWADAVYALAHGFEFGGSHLDQQLQKLGVPAHVRAVKDLIEERDQALQTSRKRAAIANAATAFVLAKGSADTLEAWDELCTAVAAQELTQLANREKDA